MNATYIAVVENPRDRGELCDKILQMGEYPTISNDVVCLYYNGSATGADKFIQLFEQYHRHEIRVYQQ